MRSTSVLRPLGFRPLLQVVDHSVVVQEPARRIDGVGRRGRRSCFYYNQLEIQSAIMVKQARRSREIMPVVDESVTGRTEALRQGLPLKVVVICKR